jgi:hypothetical protein
MPRNLAINIIINSMQTLLNADSLTVNIMQDQRNIRLVIMTAIDRHFNYFGVNMCQKQSLPIIMVLYCYNYASLILDEIIKMSVNSGHYYYSNIMLTLHYVARHILTTVPVLFFRWAVLDTID